MIEAEQVQIEIGDEVCLVSGVNVRITGVVPADGITGVINKDDLILAEVISDGEE
jgi:hypothetical protein